MNKIKSNSGSAIQLVIVAMAIVFTLIFTISTYMSSQVKNSLNSKQNIERSYLAQAGIESSIADGSDLIIIELEKLINKYDDSYIESKTSYVSKIVANLQKSLRVLEDVKVDGSISIQSIINRVDNAKLKVVSINQNSKLDLEVRDIIKDCLKLINNNNSNKINKLINEVIENLTLVVDDISIYKMSMHTHDIIKVVDNKIIDSNQYKKLIHDELIEGDSPNSLKSIFANGNSDTNLLKLINSLVLESGNNSGALEIYNIYTTLYTEYAYIRQQSEILYMGHSKDTTELLENINKSVENIDDMRSKLYKLKVSKSYESIDKVLNGVYNVKDTLNEIKCRLGMYESSTGNQGEDKEINIKIPYYNVKFNGDKIDVNEYTEEEYKKYQEKERIITIKVHLIEGKINSVSLKKSDSKNNEFIIRAKGIQENRSNEKSDNKTYEVESIVDFIDVDKKEVNYKIKSYKKLNKTGG